MASKAKLDEIKAHVAGCSICSAANKRVNDFCETGRLMFYEFAQVTPPDRIEEVEITKEQHARLVAEQHRRERNAERN